MRNRCEEFNFLHVFSREGLREVTPCTHHLAEWIVAGAAEWDAAGVHPAAAAAPAVAPFNGAVQGFTELMQAARLLEGDQRALASDLEDLGAVDVTELTVGDWEGLPTWSRLRPLQQRRLLQHAVGPQRS